MSEILTRLINLNVEIEGVLRVALNRESAEAIESAKKKLNEFVALFEKLSPAEFEQEQSAEDEAPKVVTPTEIKIEEAEGAESEPLEEPQIKDDPEALAEIEAIAFEKPVVMRSLDDLKKLFTLNDKFLFRRELFGNNDDEFNSTLELIASMPSFEETYEYLFEDLEWNPDDKNVKDFVKIIKAFFN